jgi:hypothetical protein
MLYMTKFRAIGVRHKGDEIYCYLASTWYEGCKKLIEKHTSMFREIKEIPYSRPVKWQAEGHPDHFKVYDFEIWDSEKNCCKRIEDIHPDLDINWFPHLVHEDMPGKKKMICFQPVGRSWGNVWGPEKWEEYLKPFRNKYNVFLLGDPGKHDLKKYTNKGWAITEIDDIVNIISNSDLFIGIDSGFKNIALAQMTPTLFVWAYQTEIINCIVSRDTWFPPYYHRLDWIDFCHISYPHPIFCDRVIKLKHLRKTAIIIPVHNEFEYTLESYISIRENTKRPYRLIYVNNGSSDDTRAWLNSTPSDTVVIHNDKNLGFSKAVNQAMKLVEDEDVLLLNNDVVVNKYWLERLHAVLYSDPSYGIVGPLTNHSGTPEQVQTCERENTTPKEVRHLSGFCYLIKNEVFKKVGLFNEKYFLAAEDYDYNCRVRKAGYKIMLARDVFVLHYGHVTAKKVQGADEEWRKSRDMFLNDWPEEK